MSYYTSYETSLALREAGAPQGCAEKAWYRSETRHASVIVNAVGAAEETRAFRLDEILEALAKLIAAQTKESYGSVVLDLCDDLSCDVGFRNESGERAGRSFGGNTPVEAAAACWLAVLRAAREARP